METFVPCSRESPTLITCHFLLVIPNGSGSANREAPFDGTPRSSSAMRAANLYCKLQAMRWGWSLPPSVRHHQLLAFAMMGVSTFRIHRHRLFPSLRHIWRLTFMKLQGHPVPADHFSHPFRFCSLLTSSRSSFTWRHSSSITSQLLAGQETKCPSPRHSMLPQTWEAAPSFWRSVSKSPIMKGQWLQNLNLDVKQALIHCS